MGGGKENGESWVLTYGIRADNLSVANSEKTG